MLDGEDKLIKQAKKGKAEAFGRIYDYYLPKIYRFIAIKVSSRSEAEDLAHETFLSAWQSMPSYKDQGHPISTWLYHIARNKVIDHYRTRKQNVSVEELPDEAVKVASDADHNMDVKLGFAKVREALSLLTDDQQDVMLMRFMEDMSHKEIAEAMDKTEGAVRLMQHRALEALREKLENENGQP